MTAIAKNFDPTQILSSDINGIAVYAPKATAAPTDCTVDWPTGWKSLGLIDDNGLVFSHGKSVEEKTGWNVRGVLKRIGKNGSWTMKCTAMQTNIDTHTLYYGSAPTALSTTGQTKTLIKAKSDVTLWAFGAEVPMDDGVTVERHICPNGSVTDTGDIPYTETDIKAYQLTVGAVVAPGVDYLAYILSSAAGLVAP